MMKLQTLAALAAGIALTGVAFVLAICAFDTNHAAARAADVDADLLALPLSTSTRHIRTSCRIPA
jgi:hypothetical protein